MKITVLLAFFFLLTGYAFAQSKINLISNSKSDYRIVISKTASAVEKEAADTLQSYLFKISGCRLPITNEAVSSHAKQLIIGNAALLQSKDTSGLNEDAVIIKSLNDAIVFGGGHRIGVLYSVYTFVDSFLNCKMFTYDVFRIPRMETIKLPAVINIKQTPAFDYRMSCFINLNKQYWDFNKQNYYLADWGLWVHSFDVLVPSKQYFATHPEYYALVNGKRTPGQLCLSNPDVLNILVANLASKIKEKPTLRFWSVSQNDNEFYCQCDACKKKDAEQGSHQGSILSFVNTVAAYFPDKTIVTLAYQYSQKPPKFIAPASNVLVMLCSINEGRSRPINTDKNSQFNTDLQNWLLLTHNLFIWDYVVQFSNSWSPFPNLYTLQPNIQYFHAMKVPYLFVEGFSNQSSEFSELRTYLISRLMWNANINIRETMHDFIQAYYGKTAAPYIEQYIHLLNSNAVKSEAQLHIFGSPADQRNTYLKPADIESYKAIFQKALAKLNKNDVYYKRVTKEYLSVLFAEIDVTQAIMTADNKKSASDKAKLKNLLDVFNNQAKSVNISYLNEALTSIDDYYKSKIQSLQ